MRTSDFEYELPRKLIAQYPAERRDESRLLVLGRHTGKIEHRVFRDIVEYARDGDVFVINDSEVIPARLIGRRRPTGGAVEMFLLKELGPGSWKVLVRPGSRIREGSILEFGDGELAARVTDALPDGRREVTLTAQGDLERVLETLGRVPLPPYIEREPEEIDRERYQTVYAKVRGAVAAPTAGLHFTAAVLDRLTSEGVGIARITLHVGLGTFRPIAVEDPGEHEMEAERYEISDDAAAAINRTRKSRGRVIAVGTTSVRVLETVADATGAAVPGAGATRLFIRPPHRFRCVDGLVTNFHLPRSTLLMLVSAFAGRERVLAAYRTAVREGYRFYSYGDAMLII